MANTTPSTNGGVISSRLGVPRDATITERKLWFVNAEDYAHGALSISMKYPTGWPGILAIDTKNSITVLMVAAVPIHSCKTIGGNVLPRLRKVMSR